MKFAIIFAAGLLSGSQANASMCEVATQPEGQPMYFALAKTNTADQAGCIKFCDSQVKSNEKQSNWANLSRNLKCFYDNEMVSPLKSIGWEYLHCPSISFPRQFVAPSGGMSLWCVNARNQKNGPYITKSSNGVTVVEMNYVDGKAEGHNVTRYATGQNMMEGEFKNGASVSVKQWNEKGELTSENTGVPRKTGPVAESAREAEILRDTLTLLKTDVKNCITKKWPNGQISNELCAEKRQLLYQKTYYENGKLKTQALFKNNKVVEKKFWAENGKEIPYNGPLN